MIIFPTFRWKKVLGLCCLIVSGGVIRLITKTHIGSTCCFGTDSIIQKYV